jgi:hypothetical protein
MISIDAKYHRLLRSLDLVITEGSFIRSKGLIRLDAQTNEPVGHNGIPDLIEFFSRFIRHIVITHFGTWFFKDISKSRWKIESFSNGFASYLPKMACFSISRQFSGGAAKSNCSLIAGNWHRACSSLYERSYED